MYRPWIQLKMRMCWPLWPHHYSKERDTGNTKYSYYNGIRHLMEHTFIGQICQSDFWFNCVHSCCTVHVTRNLHNPTNSVEILHELHLDSVITEQHPWSISYNLRGVILRCVQTVSLCPYLWGIKHLWPYQSNSSAVYKGVPLYVRYFRRFHSYCTPLTTPLFSWSQTDCHFVLTLPLQSSAGTMKICLCETATLLPFDYSRTTIPQLSFDAILWMPLMIARCPSTNPQIPFDDSANTLWRFHGYPLAIPQMSCALTTQWILG